MFRRSSGRRRRSPIRCATPAASTSPRCARYLDAYGVHYELVPTLVRGLDYYTRTAWEFVGPAGGSQSTISGGGRYDGLAEALGGPPTPGVGFGAGIERLLLAMEEAGVTAEQPGIDVFFALDEDAPRERVLTWTRAAARARASRPTRTTRGARSRAS